MPASSEEVLQRVTELKNDVNQSLNRIEHNIESMRLEFRNEFVTKGEFKATINGIELDIKDIKESTRWTIGTVLIPTLSLLTAAGAVVVALFVR